MPGTRFQFIRLGVFAALLIANATLWLVQSDVLRLVARERHVLLGRYSRAHFAWIIAVGSATVVTAFILSGATPQNRKRRAFATAAFIIAAVPMLLVTDIALRYLTVYPYMPGDVVYRRPPNWQFSGEWVDSPDIQRSYPILKPGYGRVRCVMSYDANGFRNATIPDRCDIVTVGDSFTEGQRVDDSETWPVLLAAQTGLSVYNLGVSGYSPPEYLASLEAYGLPLRPRIVICMLYEGNDFRSAEMAARSGVSVAAFIKTSPLLMGLDRLLVDKLGQIGARGDFPGSEVLDWMPLALPGGGDARYYGFAPKQLVELAMDEEIFESGAQWQAARTILSRMRDMCRANGAELIIAYAPNKAHVVMPAALDSVPIDKVRAFFSLRYRGPLPEGDQFARMLLSRMRSRQEVIAEWCQTESIPFVPLTEPLRADAVAGRQVYYTYDKHWSPAGHETAARVLAEHCRRHRFAQSE